MEAPAYMLLRAQLVPPSAGDEATQQQEQRRRGLIAGSTGAARWHSPRRRAVTAVRVRAGSTLAAAGRRLRTPGTGTPQLGACRQGARTGVRRYFGREEREKRGGVAEEREPPAERHDCFDTSQGVRMA